MNKTYPDRKRNRFLDVLGSLQGYGGCPRCGKNWWYAKHDNPGIMTSASGGWMLCNECYVRDRARIDANNRSFFEQLREWHNHDLA